MAFGSGIAAWFALPSAAHWIALCAGCALVAAAALAPWSGRDRWPYLAAALAVLPLMVAAGCLTVWARSAAVGESALARPISGVFVGRLLDVEPQPALARDRLVMAVREPGTGRALKVRINVPAEGLSSRPALGDLVRFRARLMPPAAPMLPGAYDFARTAWFKGIAASGTALGPLEVIERGDGSRGRLAALRQGLADHIRQGIGGEDRAAGRNGPEVGAGGGAGIAIALVTGDQGGIPEADAEAMRDSGLAHLLSISGLHVSAVVGAVYLLVVRVLALFPWLALRVRLPVVAAGAGALAGLGYTLLSGAEVPTVRSCIGALLVLAALALGREPLSLRMLAMAAWCVLLLWPETLMGPSFQMSFGAVLALVAVSTSAPARRLLAPRDEPVGTRALRHLAMLLLTGVVIDLALMPIGLHHFHRAGVYGALANMLAIPLTTFAVMPLLAGALLLDVVGAGWPLWWLAGRAIDLLTGIAHAFASLPHAVTTLPAAGPLPYVAFVAGALWIGIWSGRVRWLGAPLAAAGAALLALAPHPDILVSGDGRHVGIVTEGGDRVFVLRDGGEGYARDNMMELAGLEREPAALDRWPGARCNRDFCVLAMERGKGTVQVLVSRGRDAVPERALAAACDRADIVISDRWLPRSCHPRWLKVDRTMLGRTGGLAIRVDARRIHTVAAGQGEHGWWRPAEPTPCRRAASLPAQRFPAPQESGGAARGCLRSPAKPV
ncbi:ComEC/Rec2 family competence protein [Novosphingobium soli]|uniref:ComEC/Rec2 family competence protein n=1 Tax=Novosphingobium soli TaxID=574956 RepID=UPI0036D2C909